MRYYWIVFEQKLQFSKVCGTAYWRIHALEPEECNNFWTFSTIFYFLNKTWTWREKGFLTLFSDFLVFEQNFQFSTVCSKALWIHTIFEPFLRFSGFWTKLAISAQCAARHVEESAHLNLKSATIFGPFQCANHCLQELCLLIGQKLVLFSALIAQTSTHYQYLHRSYLHLIMIIHFGVTIYFFLNNFLVPKKQIIRRKQDLYQYW